MHSKPWESLLSAMQHFEIIDLSSDVADHAKGPFMTRMEVLEAKSGARFLTEQVLPLMAPELNGKIKAEDFPDSAFLRHEMVTASAHAGSHIDAPGHYGGELGSGSFINDAKIEDFCGPAVFYDGSDVDGPEITWEHIEEIDRNRGNENIDGKIVLIRSGPNKAISVKVIENLLDRNVKVVGTDNASFDGPFDRMFKLFLDTQDPSVLWPCHMLGRVRPYYQIEGLANLERLPTRDFFVLAPPIKIRGATAAWTRAIALVPKDKWN